MVPERKGRDTNRGEQRGEQRAGQHAGQHAEHRPERRAGSWVDEEDEAASAVFKPLTREQAQALRRSQPTVSPWSVVGAQGGLGVLVAMMVLLAGGEKNLALSALYGAATVVVPGALVARGMTSRLSSLSPGISAASVMLWEMVKISVSVAMLMLAPKLVQPLSWPVLLSVLAACLSVYWFALLWRGRKR